MPLNFVGIDPGLSGAVAILDEKGSLVKVLDTPVIELKKAKGKKRVHLEAEMATILRDFNIFEGIACVGIENVHAMPKQGVTSMFSMGTGFGIWIGILAALQIPYEKIEPRKWKSEMGIATGSDKSASIVRASQLFPTATFKKDRGRIDTLDGRADALLLAEFLRRKMTK